MIIEIENPTHDDKDVVFEPNGASVVIPPSSRCVVEIPHSLDKLEIMHVDDQCIQIGSIYSVRVVVNGEVVLNY